MFSALVNDKGSVLGKQKYNRSVRKVVRVTKRHFTELLPQLSLRLK